MVTWIVVALIVGSLIGFALAALSLLRRARGLDAAVRRARAQHQPRVERLLAGLETLRVESETVRGRLEAMERRGA